MKRSSTRFCPAQRCFGGWRRRWRTCGPPHTAVLETLVARAAQVKVDVVSRDEREADLRRVLNLGHTYGHALEEATGYRRFLHGEAVAWGLLMVTRLAELVGVLDPAAGKRIAHLVRSVGPSAANSRPQRRKGFGTPASR